MASPSPEPAPSLLAGLEAELAPFFGPAETRALLRRAGRRLGRRLGAVPHEATECCPRPIPEPWGDGHRLPAGTDPATAEWWAGFLEGSREPPRAVLLEAGEDGGWRLRPAPDGRPPEEAQDFRLPESGPLAPYQMAQLVDLSADAVLFVDRERRIRGWNRGAERMFGYTAREAIGSYFDLLVPEDLRRRGELNAIARRTESAGQVLEHLTRRRTKDGRELHVSLSRTLVRNRAGEVVGYGVILRDVTESQRLKEELHRTAPLATIGSLAAQVAHEVRNPLAGIHGALQILQRRLKPGPEEQEVFRAIQDEIARLDRLVTDLMRFGRPAPPRMEVVELGAWLREWQQRMQAEAERRGACIEVEAMPEMAVRLDPVLFETVLRNLLENALEAVPQGCRLRLSLTREGAHARLVVQDNGPGIPEEDRERVLQPFYTTRARGSGLGLAICLRHLRDMGGDLDILPSREGAAIAVLLPVAAAPARSDPPSSSA